MSAGYVYTLLDCFFLEKTALSCYTYRRGLLRCSFGHGGQCEGLKERDE